MVHTRFKLWVLLRFFLRLFARFFHFLLYFCPLVCRSTVGGFYSMPKKYSECGCLYSLGAFCVLFLMRTMVKVPCKKRVVRTKQVTDCCLIPLFVYFFLRGWVKRFVAPNNIDQLLVFRIQYSRELWSKASSGRFTGFGDRLFVTHRCDANPCNP